MKLSIEGVSKRYAKNQWGLRNLKLELRSGVLGWLGPNGAGKSTLMPLARQLPAVWAAGFFLALLTGGGLGLRLLLTGDIRSLWAWLAGAAFIPTLALALGVWTGNGKAFEILYTLLWFVGPLHQTVQPDFMESSPLTAATRVPVFYLAAAVVLGALAVAGRGRQLPT